MVNPQRCLQELLKARHAQLEILVQFLDLSRPRVGVDLSAFPLLDPFGASRLPLDLSEPRHQAFSFHHSRPLSPSYPVSS